MTQKTFAVAHLPANEHGRDIVIGDLHGQRHALMRLLDRIHFDPACDRVLATGDLCDRGPDSFGCIALLREPWMRSVSGNHEKNLLDVIDELIPMIRQGTPFSVLKSVLLAVGRDMGGDWLAEWVAGPQFEMERLNETAALLRDLPHVLAIGEGEGRFNVVHAELARAGLISDQKLDAAHGAGDPKLMETVMWSRDLYRQFVQGKSFGHVGDLSTTYCGHQVVPQVVRYAQHVFIDTGCGYDRQPWHGLTAIVREDGNEIVAFEGTVTRQEAALKCCSP